MKQIEAQIMQQSYLLVCPEGREERLMQAVQRLDAAMVKIRDAGKVKARDRIAVLAALNFAFELGDRALEPESNGNPTSGATEASTASAPVSGASNSPDASAGHPRLNQLLMQLDAALGQDGLLL
jgi:cell division protein ZapA